MTERLHFHFSLWCIWEGNGNPLQCSCLENPRDGGAWWASVYGVAQSQTRLKWLSSSSSKHSAWNFLPKGLLGIIFGVLLPVLTREMDFFFPLSLVSHWLYVLRGSQGADRGRSCSYNIHSFTSLITVLFSTVNVPDTMQGARDTKMSKTQSLTSRGSHSGCEMNSNNGSFLHTPCVPSTEQMATAKHMRVVTDFSRKILKGRSWLSWAHGDLWRWPTHVIFFYVTLRGTVVYNHSSKPSSHLTSTPNPETLPCTLKINSTCRCWTLGKRKQSKEVSFVDRDFPLPPSLAPPSITLSPGLSVPTSPLPSKKISSSRSSQLALWRRLNQCSSPTRLFVLYP